MRCSLHGMEVKLFTKPLKERKSMDAQKRSLACSIHSPSLHCSNKHRTTHSNSLQPNNQRLYFDSDTQMLPAIITTTTSDSSSAFLFPVISLYSVIPQMLDTIVGPQQMIGNEIVSPVYAFA